MTTERYNRKNDRTIDKKNNIKWKEQWYNGRKDDNNRYNERCKNIRNDITGRTTDRKNDIMMERKTDRTTYR